MVKALRHRRYRSTNNRNRTTDAAIFNIELVYFTSLELTVFYHGFHKRSWNC